MWPNYSSQILNWGWKTHHQSRALVESNPLFFFLLSSTRHSFETHGGVISLPPPLPRRVITWPCRGWGWNALAHLLNILENSYCLRIWRYYEHMTISRYSFVQFCSNVSICFRTLVKFTLATPKQFCPAFTVYWLSLAQCLLCIRDLQPIQRWARCSA